MLSRRAWGMVGTTLVVLAALGCGSSDDGDEEVDAGMTGMAGAGAQEQEGLSCGHETCVAPEGMDVEVCCIDEFASACGAVNRLGACVTMAEPDPDCPGITIGSFTMPSCCNDMGQCGVVSMFSAGGGCIELGAFAQGARDRGLDSIEFPEPQSCGD